MTLQIRILNNMYIVYWTKFSCPGFSILLFAEVLLEPDGKVEDEVVLPALPVHAEEPVPFKLEPVKHLNNKVYFTGL